MGDDVLDVLAGELLAHVVGCLHPKCHDACCCRCGHRRAAQRSPVIVAALGLASKLSVVGLALVDGQILHTGLEAVDGCYHVGARRADVGVFVACQVGAVAAEFGYAA